MNCSAGVQFFLSPHPKHDCIFLTCCACSKDLQTCIHSSSCSSSFFLSSAKKVIISHSWCNTFVHSSVSLGFDTCSILNSAPAVPLVANLVCFIDLKEKGGINFYQCFTNQWGFFCRAWKIALQDARTNTVSVLPGVY